MKLRRVGVFLSILAACGAALYLLYRDSDEAKIRKRLDVLAETLSKSGPEGPLSVLPKMQRLSDLFTKDCRVSAGGPVPFIEGERALLAAFQRLYGEVDSVAVRFYDVEVTADPSGRAARATLSATATRRHLVRRGESLYARELNFDWKKVDGAWRIDEVTVIEILR
ncbi:MAG: nuclear transport factor 2 family protein [Planctomycetota bacterium]